MLFLMKYLLIPKKKKEKRDRKKLKVETYGVFLGKHIQNGFKGFLNSSSLRLVLVLVFSFGLIHGVGRWSLRRPFWHHFKWPEIRRLKWQTICVGITELSTIFSNLKKKKHKISTGGFFMSREPKIKSFFLFSLSLSLK